MLYKPAAEGKDVLPPKVGKYILTINNKNIDL